jgi:hypothetical protein
MSEVVDLRGRELTVPPPPVLADPTGRRARLLSRAGRVLGLVALLWVAGLVLAGLGVLPAGDVPLGRAVAGPQAPSGWRHLPKPSPPTARDLTPPTPANRTAVASGYGHAQQQSGAGTSRQTSGWPLTVARQPVSVSGTGTARPTTATSAPASGVVGTGLDGAASRRHSGGAAAPGLNKTTTQGNSGSSPGRVRQATTPTNNSVSALGHTAWTPSNGHPTVP